MTNNIPIHAPLFPPSLEYGSDDAESVSVLVEANEVAVRRLLHGTPFEFVSAHAWIEIMALRGAFGVQPFAGGGVIIPARYGSTVGGYYAMGRKASAAAVMPARVAGIQASAARERWIAGTGQDRPGDDKRNKGVGDRGRQINNIPIHAPLSPPSLEYGSDDAESVSVLVAANEVAVRYAGLSACSPSPAAA
jgi:hypothetical protein